MSEVVLSYQILFQTILQVVDFKKLWHKRFNHVWMGLISQWWLLNQIGILFLISAYILLC